LKPDQRAMLQLLLERDQSYDDLASVLGTERDEVRERARAALTELGGSDPDSDVALTDYLLGQADPIGRADAVRQLQSDPETLDLAEKIAAQLQLLAPDAELPQLPRSKAKRRGAPALREEDEDAAPPRAPRRVPGGAAAGSLAARGRQMWSERRRQSIIALVAGAALLVVAVVLVTGVFGGGDEGEPSNSEPPLLGYPLAPLQADKDGTIGGQLPLEQVALTILSRSKFVDLSLTSNEKLSPAIQAALQQGQPVIDYQGTSVLRGEIADAKSGGGKLTLDLEPSDTDASGKIPVGAKDKRPFIDIDVQGLDPPPPGQTYVLWALLPEGTELPEPGATAPGATTPGATTPGATGTPGQGGGAAGGGGATTPQP